MAAALTIVVAAVAAVADFALVAVVRTLVLPVVSLVQAAVGVLVQIVLLRVAVLAGVSACAGVCLFLPLWLLHCVPLCFFGPLVSVCARVALKAWLPFVPGWFPALSFWVVARGAF